MKKYLFILLLIPIGLLFYNLSPNSAWLTDFDAAKKESEKTGKPILLYFSGSDWCGVCISLKKDIFDTETFTKYADEHLVLMQADFPRMKKNKLEENVKNQNEKLAEKYNKQGVFPMSLLLNAHGEVIKSWTGHPKVSPENFIEQLSKCKVQ